MFQKGQVVWAKLKGYPWWPAMVGETYEDSEGEDQEVLVNFIGENSQQKILFSAILQSHQVGHFEEKYKEHSKIKQKKCLQSILMADQIIKGEMTYDQQKNALDKKGGQGVKENNINNQTNQKSQDENQIIKRNAKKTIQKPIKKKVKPLSQDSVEDSNPKIIQELQESEKDESVESNSESDSEEESSSSEESCTFFKLVDEKIDFGKVELQLLQNLSKLEKGIKKQKQTRDNNMQDLISESMKIFQKLIRSMKNSQQSEKDQVNLYKSKIGNYFQTNQMIIQTFDEIQTLTAMEQIKQELDGFLTNQYKTNYEHQQLKTQNQQEQIKVQEMKDESIFNQSDMSLNQKSEQKNQNSSNELCPQQIRKKACQKLAKILHDKYGFERKKSQQQTLLIEDIIHQQDKEISRKYKEMMSLVLKLSNYKLFDIKSFINNQYDLKEYRALLENYENNSFKKKLQEEQP